MSKTDKTEPRGVKVLHHQSWLEPSHDHRDGPCDLPARPTRPDQFGGFSAPDDRRCFWTYAGGIFDAHQFCGCPHCSDQAGRKAEIRKARRTAKRNAADERSNASAAISLRDIDDLDDVAPGSFEPPLTLIEQVLGFTGLDEDAAWYAYVANLLGLDEGSLVVSIDSFGGPFTREYACDCGDCSGCLDETPRPEFTIIEILHPDGHRERRRFDLTHDRLYPAITAGEQGRLMVEGPDRSWRLRGASTLVPHTSLS